MKRLHLDFETTSACDIGLGSYRYAEDASTRILLAAVAADDDLPLLWDALDPDAPESVGARDLLREAIAAKVPIYSHHAQFELAVCTNRLKADMGLDPPDINSWRCTMAMVKRAAGPESLAKAAEFFGLEARKDDAGKALIGIFSDRNKPVVMVPPPGAKDPATGRKPVNRTSRNPVSENPVPWDWQVKVGGVFMTVRDAWAAFGDYCRQDVRTEQELHRRLKHFELTGGVLASFQFDLRMNHRGVPVNVAALRNADRITDELTGRLAARFERMTGVGHTRRAAVLEWLQARGYPADNLQASTVDEVLENPPEAMTPAGVEGLRSYSLLGYAALAKIKTMLDCACRDGMVRGTTQWHSARTGRAGGRLLQPQNLRKPTITDTRLCYQMICDGWDAQWFEELWESPLEALASSIRHFIQPHDGGMFYDADFSGIEQRLACWIVGDRSELELIVSGRDMYKHMAVQLFGTPYDAVTKEQRTIAKPIVLGCGYGVAGKTLRKTLSTMFKVERTRDECDEYVRVYRDGHPEVVDAWKSLEGAAKAAVRSPGTDYEALDGKVSFRCGASAGVDYLTLRLPSGRRLYYPNPKVKRVWKAYDEEDMEHDPRKREEGGYWTDELSYYGKVGQTWCRIATWGSRWLENCCQAMGVDLLDYGCLAVERAGFDIRMIIHDQILALHDGRPAEELARAFCSKPAWAADFPLESSCSVEPYYTKD